MKTKLNTKPKGSVQKNIPNIVQEKPIKPSTKEKEIAKKDRVKNPSKAIKPRKKGPIKKGWWNKEEVK